MKKIFSVLIILILLISLCSCSGSGTGKAIYYPLSGSPSTLDPQYADESAARIVINNIFEGLVRVKEDGTVIPGIAESWSISDDGLTYTFNLKKDTEWYCSSSIKSEFGEDFQKKFSEEKVTANDFVFAFRRAVDPSTGSSLAHRLFPIKNAVEIHCGEMSLSQLGVSAPDPLTVTVTLDKPCSDMLQRFAESVFMPCNEEFFNAMKGRYGLGTKYILCNGPFYLNAWDPEASMTVRANKYYAGEQDVLPASVTFSFDPDENSVVRKLAAGTFSAALISPENEIPENSVVTNETENGVYGFVFNCGDAVTGNPNIRKALCASVDRELFMNEKYEDEKGLIPQSCTVGDISYRQAVGENTPVIEFNKNSAAKSWEKGLKELEKSSAEIKILCTEEFEAVVRKQIQVWQSVFGINCIIGVEIASFSDISSAVNKGDFQVALTGYETEFENAAEFCADLANKNIFRFSSEEYKTIADGIENIGDEDMLSACFTAETELVRNAVCFPLYSRKSSFAVNKDVEGIEIISVDSMISFISVKDHG